MKIKKSSGGREIIDSGSFIASSKETSEISISKKGEQIKLIINFEDNKSKKTDIKVSAKKDEKKNIVTINFELINFDHALGTGFIKPQELAFFDNGDCIYIQLWVDGMGEDLQVREIVYTLYLEKNGKYNKKD